MFRAAFPAAEAVTPEQLNHYVRAVGQSEPGLYGAFPGYLHRGEGRKGDEVTSLTLVAFPAVWPATADDFTSQLDAAVAEALATPRLTRLTVLAPEKPHAAPPEVQPDVIDSYLGLDLPLFGKHNEGLPAAMPQKLRNMLARPERHAVFGVERWGADHTALVERFITSRPLAPGTRHIFRALPTYLAAAPDARLFAARCRHSHMLFALAVGDFTSLSTAFYMFAFRSPEAPPGCADALLYRIAREAETRGHSLLNLGLGIDAGIRAFKHKWRAREIMPHLETSWSPISPMSTGTGGFWSGIGRLFR